MRSSRRRKMIWMGCLVLLAGVLYLRYGDRRIAMPAVTVAPRKNSQSLRIVSFNAHLLPPIADRLTSKRSVADYRASEIANQLRRFDVVGLSEVFSETHAARIIAEFNQGAEQFCFVRSPPPARFSQFTSGGLILLSRIPILETNALTFDRGSRFLTSRFQAADGLAAKGALHARIQPGSDPTQLIDCYLTHLESHTVAIRREQVLQLSKFVRSTHRRENAILVMGDLNISGPKTNRQAVHSDEFPEYGFLMDLLTNQSDALVDTALASNQTVLGTSEPIVGKSGESPGKGGMRIDYILYGPPAATPQPIALTYRTLPLLDRQVPEGSLSDHAAVECRIDGIHQ